jgi:hypothetical protein
MAHDLITIFIDNKEKKSPQHTTGKALYELGGIDPNVYDLFRETHGHGEDELIENNNKPIEVKNEEHFFSVQKKLNPGR